MSTCDSNDLPETSALSSKERFSTMLMATLVGFFGWNLMQVTVLNFEFEDWSKNWRGTGFTAFTLELERASSSPSFSKSS